MKVLITGSSGFIGSSLGLYAARAGHTIMGTGRSAKPVSGWPGDYAQVSDSAGNRAEVADVADVIANFAPDVLFHAAGTASVGASLIDPLADFQGSALMFAYTIDAIRRSGKNPLVFIPSSAAVYGNPAALPVREDAPLKPISPYGFHKTMCELLAREASECSGLKIVVCRLFSIFGPRQRRLLIWELFKQLSSEDGTAWLEGTGTESRDFLHVDDMAKAVFQLAQKLLDLPGSYLEIVNLASGEEHTVADVATQIRDIVAPGKIVRCRGGSRPGDPTNWRADISRLHSMIPSWKPRPLLDSLHDCLESWQRESNVFRHGA